MSVMSVVSGDLRGGDQDPRGPGRCIGGRPRDHMPATMAMARGAPKSGGHEAQGKI